MQPEQNIPKRIALLFQAGYIDSVPCLMSFITLLSEQNLCIDIFMIKDDLCRVPIFNHPLINLYTLDLGKEKTTYQWRSQTLLRFSKLFSFIQFVLKKSARNKYNYYCGIEQNGLIAGFILSYFNLVNNSAKLIYFSLELQISSEIPKTVESKLFKYLEIIANRSCCASIIQDRRRAEILAQENKLDANKIYIIPNSPLGEVKFEKSYFLHNKFSINKNKTILLYAGTIAEWSYCKELSAAADELGDDYITVFQSRYNLQDDAYTTELIKNLKSNRVIFSLQSLPYEMLDDLYRSADIGLAFYRIDVLGTNCKEMGFSSGKIAYYLFCGIPIIVNHETSLAEIVNKYKCGVIINDFHELKDACKTIMSNYKYYSHQACLCFKDLLEVEKNFKVFYEQVLND